MHQHAWIAAVLCDISAYAARNDLPDVDREISATTRRVTGLLAAMAPRPPREAPCDVIRLPPEEAGRVPGPCPAAGIDT